MFPVCISSHHAKIMVMLIMFAPLEDPWRAKFKIKGTHAEPSSDTVWYLLPQFSPSSPRHPLPSTKEQDAAVWIYSGKILEPLQASRHAVIRDTELMGNQSAQVEWPGSWRAGETCLLQMHGLMSAAAFNHQPRVYLSLCLSLCLSSQLASYHASQNCTSV